MTIQLDSDKNLVRVGDNYFPARPFPTNGEPGPYGMGFCILLGETGKELSIAIGAGTYSDNYHAFLHQDTVIDVEAELEVVEVGYDFGGERDFDVTGYINDEALSRMIIAAMDGKDPF